MSELHGNIGPTRNYENLTNLPSINGVKVVGNLTPSDLGLADDASVEEIRSALESKVDKVTGKGLSENDYTDGEKAKLEGIEAGAEKNVQSDWDASDGSDAFIKNKPSVLETVTIRGTATTKSGTNTDLDVYKTAEVDSAIDTLDNKIDTNVADLDERKAEIDGYYETFTSGQTNQLIATEAITDTEPYIYRKTGGPNDVGDRVYDTIVGGSVVWNQLMKASGSGGIRETRTFDGITFTNNGDGSFTLNGTAEQATELNISGSIQYPKGHKFFIYNSGFSARGNSTDYITTNSQRIDNGGGGIHSNGNTYDLTILRVVIANGSVYNNVRIYPIVIDLTALLRPEVADYIYTLEQANAGAGVAYFRKYFPKEYYAYCEPHFEHVQTSAKVTVGFNQWDEEWELGTFNTTTGEKTSSTATIRSKNKIKALPNTVYALTTDAVVLFYDSDENYISYVANNRQPFTTPTNCGYLNFRTGGSYGTTYNHDICVNIHGDRDGEYEPYKKRTYPIEPKVLRGVPKLDSANRLYFDGDIYEHDGTVTRRYGIVDLGTLNYSKTGSGLFASGALTERIKPSGSPSSPAEGIFCGLYPTVVSSGSHAGPQGATPSPDMTMSLNAYGTLYFNNTSYTDAAAFKTAMSGVYLLYALKTPTTETAEPFQYPMVVDPLGTEEFVDYGVEEGTRDVSIVVGHSSEYPADLRGKLQRLPSPTGTNGDYIVTEVDGKLYLKPYVPAVGLTAPTTEGEGE